MSGSRSAAERIVTHIELASATARAVVLPLEGAVADELTVDGRSVLARTPWADDVSPGATPADDEAAWVRRWRGGWQLCFPTAGQPEPGADPPQSFHGVASQAEWSVVGSSDDGVELEWSDAHGLVARRSWRLAPDGLSVATLARNEGTSPREVIVAEHLVFGQDVLGPVVSGSGLRIAVPAGTRLAPLDYDGMPAGRPVRWPGSPADRWEHVDDSTPPRVAAVVAPLPREIVVEGPELTAVVTWRGLDHALVGEELAQSPGDPWNSSVVALGIEPTTTPHGAGTARGDALTLAPGEAIDWSVSLRVALTGTPTPTQEDT
jgi:hypothetical protein